MIYPDLRRINSDFDVTPAHQLRPAFSFPFSFGSSIKLDLLGDGLPAGVAKPHLEAAFGAGGVAAVEDDGLGPVEADGASLLLVETLLFQLKRRQFFRKLLRVVFLHFTRLAFGVGYNIDLLLDGFSAFALFPPGAAVGAGVLVMARVELDVGRRLFAEGASRQFRAEGLAQEVDDFLRGARRVGDVQGRVAFVVAVADFQPLFDGEL